MWTASMHLEIDSPSLWNWRDGAPFFQKILHPWMYYVYYRGAAVHSPLHYKDTWSHLRVHCHAVGGIFLRWFGSTCPLRGSALFKSVQSYSEWSPLPKWWNISIPMGLVCSRMKMSPFIVHTGSLNGLMMKMMSVTWFGLHTHQILA